MVPTVEEQSLVIGDVMKNIDELYSSRSNFEDIRHVYDANGQIAMSVEQSRRPKYLLIFIDEINRFLPQAYPMGRRTAVAEQIAKTLIAGRSRDTILLSAQQFKSSTDPILHENTGIHMIAKLGMSELSKSPYAMLDDITKNNIKQYCTHGQRRNSNGATCHTSPCESRISVSLTSWKLCTEYIKNCHFWAM